MRRGIASLAILLGVFVLALGPAAAQELTSGTIAGKVSDPAGKPIAGAIVIVTSQYGTKTGESDADGNFIVPFLKPGTYTVRVEAAGGFNTVIQNDVSVGLNQRTTLGFTLEPGKTETITVTAAAPLVDIRSTATGTSVKYEEFANAVPLGRAFTDTYAVAPGVVSGLGTGQGNYSISGSSGLENTYLIDGVNITNTGYGGIGAYNIVFGSLGTGVTSEFLDEVQIKTGGFEAEFGQALGGIVNTIVKSGTNDFKGSVAWFSSPGGSRSDFKQLSLSAGNTNLTYEDRQDFAFSVGGPIKKDKLWYFVAYNPVITKQRIRATDNLNPAYDAAVAGNSRFTGASGFAVTDPLAFPSSIGDLDRRRSANNYAAKLTWQANAKNVFELTFFGDPSLGEEGFQRGTSARFTDFASGGGQSEIEYGAHNGTVKWNAVFTPKFFMEAQIGRHVGRFRETSVKDESRYTDLRNNLEYRRGATSWDDDGIAGGTSTPFTSPITPVQTYEGGVGFISNQDDKSTTYQLKFTNVVGKHEVKWGVEYADISYLDTATYSGQSFNISLPVSNDIGDPVDADADGVQDAILLPTRGGGVVSVRNGTGDPTVAYDSSNRFRVTRARLFPEAPPTTTREYNAFIQDAWQITPRLTVRYGLRATQQSITGAGAFTLPFGTKTYVDSFGVTHRIFQPGTSDYRPDSYSFTSNYAPRAGFSYDLRGNGKTRLYLNYGRYFERIPNDLAVRALSNEVGISLAEFSNKALTSPRLGGPSPSCDDGAGGTTTCTTLVGVFTQGIESSNVVAGVKLPYVDDLTGGYAFELTPTSALEVRAIYRKQGRVLEDVQVNSVEQIQNFYYGTGYGYPYDPFGGSPSSPASPTFPATVFGAYELANPGTSQVPAGGLFPFPKPERIYKALELIYTRRLQNNWSVYANYRYAKLDGNYEGLFRNDNGQSDPNITSLYDFPSSPLLATQFESGPLPSDVRHVLHVYPSYTFPFKLRVGANLTYASGVPRTSMLAHPSYQNAGEIPGKDPVYSYWSDPDIGLGTSLFCDSTDISPCTLATTSNLSSALTDPNVASNIFLTSYTPVKRGNLGRTPSTTTIDLHFDYPLALGKTSLVFMFDVFNATDSQKVTLYNDNVELLAGVLDPDYLRAITYQDPREFRLAARWSF